MMRKLAFAKRLLVRSWPVLPVLVLATCTDAGAPGVYDVNQIFILPQHATVAPGQTVQFLAFGMTPARDTVPIDVTWSATAGAIEPDGRYTASPTPGDYEVTAASTVKLWLTDTAQVSVSAAATYHLVVIPDNVTIDVADSVDFVAIGLTNAGDTILVPVQWSVSEGSIRGQGGGNVSGRYKPGHRSKQQRVVAQDSAGTSSDSATVTVLHLPAASVDVQPNPATVRAGATAPLTAAARDSTGGVIDGKTFQWASANTGIATVDASGVITGVAMGSTSVTATADGATGTTSVTVSEVPVASVTVTPASASLYAGQTRQFAATVRDSTGNTLSGRPVSWTTSNASVATVSGSGMVTAVAAGTAAITATSEGKSGTAAVAVSLVPVASVTVSPAAPSLGVGATVQLTATLKDSAGNTLTGRAIAWTSGNASLATVSAAGLVTGVGAGTVTITAASEGKSGSATVTVTAPVATVTVTPGTSTRYVGQTVQLTATLKDAAGNTLTGRTVTWATSSATVATVSNGGLVTARAVGNATITATSEGKNGTATVSVTLVPVASVSVTPATRSIYVGGTGQFTATPRDSAGTALTGRQVTWATGSVNIATISSSGLVTGVSVGTTPVIATVDSVSGNASLTVATPTVTSVAVTPASFTTTVQGSVQFSATARDSAGQVVTGRTVAWSTADPGVATVSSTGLATGVAAGTTAVAATVDGVSGSGALTVSSTQTTIVNAACSAYAAPAVPAPLRTFYVDAQAGNDGNNGLSAATAWRTLAKANQTAQPGDRFLLAGTFSNQMVYPNASGTASNRIVYAVAPGRSATLTGSQTVVLLDQRSYIVIDGLELTNTGWPTIQSDNGDYNWLRNLSVHDTQGSSFEGGSSDNRIEDSRFERIGNEAGNAGEGIAFARGASRNVIVRNVLGSAGHASLLFGYNSPSDATTDDNIVAQNLITNPWANNIGLLGKANRTLVECNRLYNSADGSGANYARYGLEIEGSNSVIRFNEIITNGAGGITMEGRSFGGFVQTPRNNLIYNNTIWNNGGESLRFLITDVGVIENNTIENNIFWQNAGFSYSGTTYAMSADLYHANSNPWPTGTIGGNIVRNNIFPTGQSALLIIRSSANSSYTWSQAQATFAGWASNLQANPLFTNTATGDFTLQAGSPAINAGIPISGVPYLGSAPDLGAREKQ